MPPTGLGFFDAHSKRRPYLRCQPNAKSPTAEISPPSLRRQQCVHRRRPPVEPSVASRSCPSPLVGPRFSFPTAIGRPNRAFRENYPKDPRHIRGTSEMAESFFQISSLLCGVSGCFVPATTTEANRQKGYTDPGSFFLFSQNVE